jgi:diguanylate cyclase (GGDEF)-like protein
VRPSAQLIRKENYLDLDVRTLAFVSGLIPFILGVIMAVYWRTRRVYDGFGRWVVANFLLGIGFLLLDLRGFIPDFLSIIVGNGLIIYSLVLMYEGIQLFFNRPAINIWNYLILVTYIVLQFYLTYTRPDINARIILASAGAFILNIRSGASLLRDAPADIRRAAQGAGIVFITSSIFPLIRAAATLQRSAPIDLAADQTQNWYLLYFTASIIIWSFYFFFLNSAHLEIDLEIASRGLEKLANTDSLTGLDNRRCFIDMAENEIQRAKRFGERLFLLMLDADDFKLINDQYGHQAGDSALLHLTELFRKEVRTYDLLARLGGDEFVMLLTRLDKEQALKVAERIRKKTEDNPLFIEGKPVSIQLSIGLTRFQPDDSDLNSILRRADQALLEAKKQGKNRIVVD